MQTLRLRLPDPNLVLFAWRGTGADLDGDLALPARSDHAARYRLLAACAARSGQPSARTRWQLLWKVDYRAQQPLILAGHYPMHHVSLSMV